MKKLFIVFAISSTFFSCKKETTNTNSTTNSSNSVACVDNPNINFTSIGTPVGKFSDCIKDVDGNVYKTVTIGTQTWMAENLKTSKYNDGTPIQNVKDSLEWSKLITGAWCYYDNDEKYNAKYGKLYNWYAVSPTTNGNKNVCPNGWHLPSDNEWMVLIYYLGGERVAGNKLKEVGTNNWSTTNSDATNTSLFSAIPGGIHNDSDNYEEAGHFGYWWSADDYYGTNVACGHTLSDTTSISYRVFFKKTVGFSVRCLK